MAASAVKHPILLAPVLACLLTACGTATGPAASNQAAASNLGAASNQASGAPAAGPSSFPALTGRVVDSAELLTPAEEAGLTSDLETLERRTTDQFVVVTVPDLGGRDIADYSRDLGNHWAIGQAGRNNGVLLVVAPAEHKVRIAVGDGLTSQLTNQEATDIIARDLVPQFRDAHWFAGVQAGSRAIIAQLAPAANDNAPARR